MLSAMEVHKIIVLLAIMDFIWLVEVLILAQALVPPVSLETLPTAYARPAIHLALLARARYQLAALHALPQFLFFYKTNVFSNVQQATTATSQQGNASNVTAPVLTVTTMGPTPASTAPVDDFFMVLNAC